MLPLFLQSKNFRTYVWNMTSFENVRHSGAHWVLSNNLVKPIWTGFWPFTQKIFMQPIPKISWLFLNFGCGYPCEIFFPNHIFLDIIKDISRFLGPPYKQKEEKFHIWSVGYQNRIKRVRGVHFWRNFWKILKNEDFGLKFLKRAYLKSFFQA